MSSNEQNRRRHVPIPQQFAPDTISNELARCLHELSLEMTARQIPEDRLWGPDGILETLMHKQNEFSGINRPYLRRQVVEEAISRLRSADAQQRVRYKIRMLCLVALAFAILAALSSKVFTHKPAPAGPTYEHAPAEPSYEHAPVDPFTDAIMDACDLHVRWAHAIGVPPAQVDLYSALGSSKLEFSGSIDDFAGRFSKLMEAEHCASNEGAEECRTRTTVAIRILEFLRDKNNRDVYDAKILPLARNKKAQLRKTCGW